MLIDVKKEKLDKLLTALNKEFKGKPFTDSNMIAMQDRIEHALLTYDKEDIEQERFLNLHVVESDFKKTMQLFIEAKIYIEVKFDTVVFDFFQKIGKIQEIKVLKADSL